VNLISRISYMGTFVLLENVVSESVHPTMISCVFKCTFDDGAIEVVQLLVLCARHSSAEREL
jgi:hypothetical protein